jgi:hypothetical protein
VWHAMCLQLATIVPNWPWHATCYNVALASVRVGGRGSYHWFSFSERLVGLSLGYALLPSLQSRFILFR